MKQLPWYNRIHATVIRRFVPIEGDCDSCAPVKQLLFEKMFRYLTDYSFSANNKGLTCRELFLAKIFLPEYSNFLDKLIQTKCKHLKYDIPRK